MLHTGQLGVHPPGALGVAFFVHARANCLIGRGGDGITEPLAKAGMLNLDEDHTQRVVNLRDRIFANLLEADALDHMPELLLVCCNPDQLGEFTLELTRFLENLAQRGRLRSFDDIAQRVPMLLILPNGILAEQTLETYEEQLEESLLMQRLPGVTTEMTQALLNRVVRGVSLQAGGRRGSGAETVYVLERKGSLVFAGGGENERERIEAILGEREYPFVHARNVPGTRIEFDKAMISIVLNVGGLIHAVKPNGELIDLRMGDLCKDPSKEEFIKAATQALFEVGRAVGAYPKSENCEAVWAKHRDVILAHAGHVTSSLKTFRDALGAGLAGLKLFSNEEWILTPLARYAAKAGLKSHEVLFRSLRRQVQEAMARAIRQRDQHADGQSARARAMKLAAQRNFSIELYDAADDNMLMVGTMLDDEHLLKLEVNVFLPDEQITRARLDMIRTPFPVCRQVEHVAERLIGLRIDRGVIGEINRRVGGRVGCSHIKELATNIVYFAASHLVRRRSGVDPMAADYVFKPAEERFGLTKDLLRDSCLAYCQTTPQALDAQIGIRRVGEEHASPVPLGAYETSLGAVLRDRAEHWSAKPYIRYRTGDETHTLTFGQFAEGVARIARNLLAQGLTAGDRVCLLSENRAEMFMVEMALVSIGAVTVPIFAGYPPRQVAYVLGHSRPRMVIVSGTHQLEKIERQRHPWIEKFYCMDFDAAASPWGALDFATLTTEGGASEDQLNAAIDVVRPDDLCIVMYTSGTTGPPKGVQLCHRNIISQQKALSLLWEVGEHDVFMSYLPWHHSFGGLFERFMTLYNGSELCLDDSRGRDMQRQLDNWRVFNPSLFFSVPRVHDMIMAQCRERPEVADMVFNGRLRMVFTAGAALPAPIEAAYRARGIPVLEGWGLTETSPCVTCTTMDRSWRSGYVGDPIPGVTIRIDGDQEILVKGPNVMLGYLDDEEDTARVIDADGWFHTGDLGEFTSDGLRIFGRKDGAFKLTSGEKVHPQRIENVLVNESPYINLAIVLGSGENYVGALIYPDFSRLREWAREHGVTDEPLADSPAVLNLYARELQRINTLIEVKYQQIARAALAGREPSLSAGELTPSGKLVRKAIIASFQNKVDGLFAARPPSNVIVVPQTETQRTLARVP